MLITGKERQIFRCFSASAALPTELVKYLALIQYVTVIKIFLHSGYNASPQNLTKTYLCHINTTLGGETLKYKLFKAKLNLENFKNIIKSQILLWSVIFVQRKKVLKFIMGHNIPYYINKSQC